MVAVTESVPGPNNALEPYQEWTPEALTEAIEREKKMRSIIIQYYRDAMVAAHHYYNLPAQKDRKASLSKEGALNLCSLFKVIPEPDAPHEIFQDDGHYIVRARLHLLSLRTGEIV